MYRKSILVTLFVSSCMIISSLVPHRGSFSKQTHPFKNITHQNYNILISNDHFIAKHVLVNHKTILSLPSNVHEKLSLFHFKTSWDVSEIQIFILSQDGLKSTKTWFGKNKQQSELTSPNIFISITNKKFYAKINSSITTIYVQYGCFANINPVLRTSTKIFSHSHFKTKVLRRFRIPWFSSLSQDGLKIHYDLKFFNVRKTTNFSS